MKKTSKYIPALKAKYIEQIIPNLKKEFNYKSIMQVPRIEKMLLIRVWEKQLLIKN